MKNFFLFLILIITMISCDYETPYYVKIAHKITNSVGKKIGKEKELVFIGTGGGMMDDIKILAMGFQYYKIVDLDTARELVVHCVKEYLAVINSDEKVRPYLYNYPFTAKNVEIRIWIFTPDRKNPPFGEIYYVSALDGILSYYINPSKDSFRKTICEETYEEGEKIVQSKLKQFNSKRRIKVQ